MALFVGHGFEPALAADPTALSAHLPHDLLNDGKFHGFRIGFQDPAGVLDGIKFFSSACPPGMQRTRGTGSLGCRAKRKIRSQQKLTYQLASKAANQPVRIPSACALDLLRFDIGYRKNLLWIVQELTETIFGVALSRPQSPISSLCRNSCSAPSLP